MTERRTGLVKPSKFLKQARLDYNKGQLWNVHWLPAGHSLIIPVVEQDPIPFTAKHVAVEFELIDLTKEDGCQVATTPLEVGVFAKVGCVGRGCTREWFWVIVTDIRDGQYTGEMANPLISRLTPKYRDSITFAANNVLLVRPAAEMMIPSDIDFEYSDDD
jgi:hypothetical protein